MKASPAVCRLVVACAFVTALVGCEEEKPKAAAASATATPAATPEKAERPTKVETEVTPARRAAVESKHAAAKGFLVASELEAKLKANKALKDKKGALAAFDKAASGKWVLFTGPMVNLTEDGFDVGIVYTPQLPNDPMGMSRQFFEVSLSKIEGYSKSNFKDGNMVVVLAKYNGAAKASPGHELIATGDWK